VSRYQKGITDLDFTEATDSEVAVASGGPYASLHLTPDIYNHASTSPLTFLQAGCPSCCPTNGVKALKAAVAAAVILVLTCQSKQKHEPRSDWFYPVLPLMMQHMHLCHIM